MKLRGILRIVYIAFGVIMAIIIAIMAYNTNGYNFIYNKTQAAIKDKNYVEVAKIHGGNFWDQTIATENSDVVDVVIYPASTLTQITYYTDPEKDTTTTYNVYEKAYYINTFILTKMDTKEFSKGGVMTNETGLRFYGDTVYNYYYTISDTVNSSKLTAKPTSPSATIIHGARKSRSFNNWGFFGFTLTESMYEAMKSDGLSGVITKVGILDANGEEVTTLNVTLDFEHEFFDDVHELIEQYNTYIDVQTNPDSTDAMKKEATDKFNAFYNDTKDENGNVVKEGFESKFLSTPHCTFRYKDSELQPASLIWQTIGIIALVIVVLALLYMLLFHFKFLKSLISRERWAGRKNLGTRGTVKTNAKEIKEAPKANTNKPNKATLDESKEEKTETKVEQNIEETKVEENVEEAKEDKAESNNETSINN